MEGLASRMDKETIYPYPEITQTKTKLLTTLCSKDSRFCLLTNFSTGSCFNYRHCSKQDSGYIRVSFIVRNLLQKELNSHALRNTAFSFSPVGLPPWLTPTYPSGNFSHRPSLIQGWVRYSTSQKHWWNQDHCLSALSMKLQRRAYCPLYPLCLIAATQKLTAG